MKKNFVVLFTLLIFDLIFAACSVQQVQLTPTATQTLPASKTPSLSQTPTAEKTTEPTKATATSTPDAYKMNPVPKELLSLPQAENKSNKLIVFSNPYDVSGKTTREIYVMGFDGSNVKNLTNNKADDWNPIWSPDGKKILFFSNRNHICNDDQCQIELFAMNVDGTGIKKMSQSLFASMDFSWSPDLKRIAIEHDFWDPRPHGDVCCGVGHYGDVLSDIFIINPIDSYARNITGTLQPGGFNYVNWNPNGKQFAFLSIYGRVRDEWLFNIYVTDTDGTDLRKLPNGLFIRGNISSDAWSKDGKRLAFLISNGIAIVNADGGGYSEYPIEQYYGGREIFWLDDNQHLVFTDANGDFYKINTDFTGLEKLTFATETEKLIYLFEISKASTMYFTDKDVLWFATSSHQYRYDYDVSKKKVLSPNGEWIAHVQSGDSEQHVNSQLRAINTENHQDYFVINDAGEVNWDPNSVRLFFLRGQKLFAVNLDGTGLQQISNEAMGEFEIQP